MAGQLAADFEAMQGTGSTLVSQGYGMSTSLRDDASGCGSQGVESAVLEFALSVAVELGGVQAQVVAAGQVAKDAAAELQATDATIAASA
ncbi:hypothetical protein ACH436_17510 [Isoptericola sp. NPDC019693]|uniref:hypothetical protein n=1 Tax=Isoptericola sp. NPDC019693 TaxID=3364009 RepID=UPI00379923A4